MKEILNIDLKKNVIFATLVPKAMCTKLLNSVPQKTSHIDLKLEVISHVFKSSHTVFIIDADGNRVINIY